MLILQGSKLGHEGPVTLKNCQLGPKVELKGGFFRDAVFLKNVSMGSGSNVREGTILEEESRVAHSVGLKQTILLPFVTLGSLINFCDCLMAGGTSRKDHSEVWEGRGGLSDRAVWNSVRSQPPVQSSEKMN